MGCAQFSNEDYAVVQIGECVPEGQQVISKACSQAFKNKAFHGQFVNIRSKHPEGPDQPIALEIKLGLTSVICKTQVTQQNQTFIKSLFPGDAIAARGTPRRLTRFKNSKHSYISIDDCTLLF